MRHALLRYTFLVALCSAPAGAAVFHVTSTADTLDGVCDDHCSLREAIVAANHNGGTDVVMVGPGTYTLTRPGAGEDLGATGDLDSTGGLQLVGAGARDTIIDGGGLDRVLDASGIGAFELFGLTVRNGHVDGDGGGIRATTTFKMERCLVEASSASHDGGGVFATGSGQFVGSGDIVIDRSTIAGNEAGDEGGGLWAGQELILTSSTISGNHADSGGGVALIQFFSTIQSVTITGNSAHFFAGGIATVGQEDFPSSGEFAPIGAGVGNSIVAGNTAPIGADCQGLVDSDGANLFGRGDGCAFIGDLARNQVGTAQAPIDPLLAPLGDYGGPTPTHPLLAGSPAIDTGAQVLSSPTIIDCHRSDQRQVARPADGNLDGQAWCDIGAYERSETCLTAGGELCLGKRFRVTASWSTEQGTGAGQALPAAADTGYFWFFAPGNVELTVKVLDGCGVNGHYWVFTSGLTDVGVELAVDDTRSGRRYVHTNPRGQAFAADLATEAIPCD
ncbi:MAG TPA: CSLREA domain-containing protein [Thermoanaerobaculia bacterium]|nr:CSLREA domain-containing protein [Thermoanaerobaculia bacterium]